MIVIKNHFVGDAKSRSGQGQDMLAVQIVSF